MQATFCELARPRPGGVPSVEHIFNIFLNHSDCTVYFHLIAALLHACLTGKSTEK